MYFIFGSQSHDVQFRFSCDIFIWFFVIKIPVNTDVYRLFSSSPSRARTYNPSVNSRMLYHWAIEEYQYFPFLRNCTFKTSYRLIKCRHYAISHFRFTRKFDSLNSTFALRLALIKFLRTTIALTSNGVLRLVLAKCSWSSPRTISISQLHASLHFHPWPIYLILSMGPYNLRWDIWGELALVREDRAGQTAGAPVVIPMA